MENVSKFVTIHMVATGVLVKLGTDWNLMASAAVVSVYINTCFKFLIHTENYVCVPLNIAMTCMKFLILGDESLVGLALIHWIEFRFCFLLYHLQETTQTAVMLIASNP